MITKISKLCMAVVLSANLLMMSSCEDMFMTESNRLMYEEDNTLSTPDGLVYSLLGILTKLQNVADRYVLLGEMKGDLVQTTDYTKISLREIADYNVSVDNEYNYIKDYYEIINNCNYYIAKADTSIENYINEYAAIKSIRAWTYLQMAIHYGEVSFSTEPILRVVDAQKEYETYDIDDICRFFIEDLTPLKDISYPEIGSVFSIEANYLFIPISILLGDMHLWLGQYEAAAEAYYDYIFKNNLIVTSSLRAYYSDFYFKSYGDSWSSVFSNILPGETIHLIPFATDPADGKISELNSLFSSISDQAQIAPSISYIMKGEEQAYLYSSEESGSYYTRGDLRLPGSIAGTWNNGVFTDTSCIKKFDYTLSSTYSTVTLCRASQVYLKFAEACNRAGYSSFAYAVLKYGLTPINIDKYVKASEKARNPRFMNFSADAFSDNSAIHDRGCGNSARNDRYAIHFTDSIPLTANQDSLVMDSIAKVDSVEQFICDELALETAFEGNRFFDLMRISRHRNDPSFLANKVAMRTGVYNSSLYNLLLDEKNWFLPKK